MYYFTREEQNEARSRKINMLRQAAAVYPHLRDVITAFDGKVLNVKLEKALSDENNRYFVQLKRNESYGDMLYITVHLKGFRNWHDECTLVSLNLKGKWDGKRIPAALILENAREQREKMLKEAENLESITPERIDEINNQIEFLFFF